MSFTAPIRPRSVGNDLRRIDIASKGRQAGGIALSGYLAGPTAWDPGSRDQVGLP